MNAPQLPAPELCTLDQRRPLGIGLICWRHYDQLRDLLDPMNTGSPFDPTRPDDLRVLPSIPVMFAQLNAMPAVSGPAVVGSSAFGSRPPADLHVISLRDPRSSATGPGPDDDGVDGPWSTLAVLQALAERVDRRDFNGNRIWPPRPVTVPALSRWLYAAVDWLAARDWIDQTFDELRTLSGQLRAATGDAPPRSVGTCKQPVDDDGQPNPAGPWRCAWPLHLPTMPPRGLDEAPVLPSLRCGSCGYRYGAVELAHLGNPALAAAS